jgi:sugar phosphate isomerase/epimerase
MSQIDRRDFFMTAGLAGAALIPQAAVAATLTEKQKLAKIASNTWPCRQIFKTRASASGRGGNAAAEMKKKYGEITMLDFPQFTKETFPGVTTMDLFSGLFGDVNDDSMYTGAPAAPGATQNRGPREFDPSTESGKKWLEKLANTMVKTGTKCQHISNNAPRDLAEHDVERRKAGVAVAKKWLDAGKIIGAKSMRVNSGGPRILPESKPGNDGYPKNEDITKYLDNCIESLKELADYGGKVGVKVTLENHWGLTANPTNIVIMINAVNNKFCEATPDFCNWEHEHMLFNGLRILAPYSHSNVHAKYWSRWGDKNDVRKSVKIMMDAKYDGVFALEYEEGPHDYIEGAKYLYKEVLAAL